MKITLTKETVNTYAPYVRISTTKSNPNTGAVRVSNSGARWGLSGTDFAQLLKASIFMMAYSLETVESIRQEYDLRKDVEFEVQGISPIEMIQLSESAVNREVPKGGRPKPKFANLEGDLIMYGTQPRKIGKLSPAGKSIKTNEGNLVGVSSEEPTASKGSKKETLNGSKKANKEVEKKAEVLDDSSVRFHNAGETVLPVNLEKELEDLKAEYKKLEDSYNDEVAKGKGAKKEIKSLKEDLKDKEKALNQAEEQIKTFEEKEKGFELAKTEWASEKKNMEDEKKATAEYIQTLEDEHKGKLNKAQETILAKEREVLELKNAQDELSKQLQEVRASVNALKTEKEKKTILGALSDLKDAVVDGLKKLFGQK